MAELSKMESDARDLLMSVGSQSDLQPSDVCVRNVFWAKYQWAMPIDQIQKISEAFGDLATPVTSDGLKPAVNRFVKLGILRSRKIQGVVHYEVNFKKDYI